MGHEYTGTRDLTFDILMEDIEVELANSDYEGRCHGKSDVYRDGCRGPLCRYRERTRKRLARESRAKAVLPVGVLPERRTRGEQRWDMIIEGILHELVTISAEDWINKRLAGRGAMLMPVVRMEPASEVRSQAGAHDGHAMAVRDVSSPASAIPRMRPKPRL